MITVTTETGYRAALRVREDGDTAHAETAAYIIRNVLSPWYTLKTFAGEGAPERATEYLDRLARALEDR